MSRRRLTAAVAALACAGVAASGVATAAPEGPAADAAARKKVKKVKVADNFFAPDRMRVRRGTRVVWKWSRLNGETHDVYLLRKPRGVRRFQSAPAATAYTYRRKLRKPGVYKLICTFHENMTMRIRVRR